MIGRLRGMVVEVESEDCVIRRHGRRLSGPLRCAHLGRLPAVATKQCSTWNMPGPPSRDRGFTAFLSRDERAAYRLLTAIRASGPRPLSPYSTSCRPATSLRPWRATQGRHWPGKRGRTQAGATDRHRTQGQAAQRRTDVAGGVPGGGAAPPAPSVSGDAVAALMGPRIAEILARRAVDQILAAEGPGVDLSTLIRLSLRELGR